VLLFNDMRLLVILLLTLIYVSASSQNLIGKYNAYYGHTLRCFGVGRESDDQKKMHHVNNTRLAKSL